MNNDIERSMSACVAAVKGFMDGLKQNATEATTTLAPSFYRAMSVENQELISLEKYTKEIIKTFSKKDPPKGSKSHDIEPWLEPVWRNCDKIRFESYLNLLADDNKRSLVPQLKADTFEILDSCGNPQDPRSIDKSWDRRGLVYGHVQSGKTANYVGLINRAFDVGYKVVIVFTGVTEDLRKQTQERIDSGVIGRDVENHRVGIGNYPQFRMKEEIKAATTINGDLKSKDDWRNQNLSVNEKSIWVIKKNKTVLENLISWLDSQSVRQGTDYAVQDIPFLIIDDEADNASIQTMSKRDFNALEEGINLGELDEDDLTEENEQKLEDAKNLTIKTINRNIRIILSLIAQKTFVAYTATPYSVINQNDYNIETAPLKIGNKEYVIERDSDLFPKHFIIPIGYGAKYMGIEKIFPNDSEKKIPIVTNINKNYNDDVEKIFTNKRGEDYSFTSLPDSLKDAIVHFIVTIFVRKSRTHRDYNSMLIHTSHLTAKADYLADKINEFITKITEKIQSGNQDLISQFNYRLDLIRKNSENPLYKKYFGKENKYYVPVEITKLDILDVLKSNTEPLEIVSYHSSKYLKDDEGNKIPLRHSNHDLSFKSLKDNPEINPKNYIVIGGNRLSRGLTLEGLTTSYFIRNSSRQDSLYQMGRWFGYRIGFEDCVQIFMKEKQIKWYTDIYMLEVSLRADLEDMNDRDIEPRNWAIKIANHKSLETLQNKITVCDPAKLRNTQLQKISFSGTNKITKKFNWNNKEDQKFNYKLIKKFINDLIADRDVLFKKNSDLPSGKFKKDYNLNFLNISPNKLLPLLNDYHYHKDEGDEFIRITDFIRKNMKNINSFSVVLKQLKRGCEINDRWIIQRPNKEDHIITGLTRTNHEGINGVDDPNHAFSSIIEGVKKSNERIFDIIDNEEKIKEFEGLEGSKLNSYVYNLRKESGKGLVVFSFAESKDVKNQIIPFLHIVLPGIKDSVKIDHIVRKRRNHE